MSSTHVTAVLPEIDSRPLSPALTLTMAAGAGFSVASLYYAQPMLGLITADLPAGGTGGGFVPALTQLGYALGIALLAPLGDRFNRRRIIAVKAVLLALALLAMAIAGSLPGVLLASLLIGLTATLAQDIVPAAATLAPAAHRGAVVGRVMTGLLLGILLSRVASGVLSEVVGWRAVYVMAAVAVAAMGTVLVRALPAFVPTTRLGYGALLASLLRLWREQPLLRRAALSQGLLAVGFSAFWSTLALMLQQSLHLGSAVAGAFGIAGAAGALAAPLAGRWADRIGAAAVARRGAVIALLGFAVLGLQPWLPTLWVLPLLAVSAVVFDFGYQSAQIAHQTLVYGLQPEARSRLNALLFTGIFIGMATGGALGTLLYSRVGWMGVVGVAVSASTLALLSCVRRR